MMLKLQYFVFSTALVSKQKQRGNFMLGSWQGVNGRKNVESPWFRGKDLFVSQCLNRPNIWPIFDIFC